MGHLHRNALLAVANVAAGLVAQGMEPHQAKRIARETPKGCEPVIPGAAVTPAVMTKKRRKVAKRAKKRAKTG